MPVPANIGRFRLEAVLGRGGMGEVYKAFDPTLQRVVAIKTVRPDIQRPDYLERLMREAQAGARLQHPHIVTVYEAGQTDGLVYIAMEFLKGDSLDVVLRRGQLTFDAKLNILATILEALQHAHGEGVIHRDIKPSNVNRQPDGCIKLLDFGLARVVRPDALTMTATVSGTMMGTLHYASPEQLKGEAVDHRSDVYSTGALAYEMLSGRCPFHADDDSALTTMMRVVSEPAAPMDTAWTRHFPEIERIVAKAMVKSPDGRYQTATEMREAVVAFQASHRDEIAAVEAQLNTLATQTAVSAKGLDTNPAAVAGLWRKPLAAWSVVGAVLILAMIVVGFVKMRPPDAEGASAPPAVPNTRRADATSTLPGTVAAAVTAVPTPAASLSVPNAEPRPTEGAAAAPATSSPPSGVLDVAADPRSAKVATAKELFTVAGGRAATGLKYRLIQRIGDDAEQDADPAATFFTGDQVKFAFESNVDGYLYVVQQGSTGRWAVLFPAPDINGGRNAVKSRQQYQVPDNAWFGFDENPGTEQVFVIFSKEPLGQLPGFKTPVMQQESVRASVVEDLQQSIRPRDLIFQKDQRPAEGGRAQQASYIVDRDELGKAVTALIPLKHERKQP
jgi:hypothetical protein